MKQSKKHNLSSFILILGIICLCIGIFYPIPDREIPWDYEEYVGGDAYNIIIEASIRGGEIAGATVAKSIYTVFGISLILVSRVLKKTSPQNNEFKEQNTEEVSKNLEQMTSPPSAQ